MRELWVGPAGTGKTQRVLEIIEDYLTRQEGQKLLVLLPTESLVTHFKALLLTQKSLPGFVGQFLFTFHGLSYFLASQKRSFTLAGNHQKILLLEEVLKQNCPPPFKGVQDYLGFRQSLLKSFRELKEHQIDHTDLSRQIMAFEGKWSGKSLDRYFALTQVYEDYQKALKARGWWEAEDLLKAAADLLGGKPAWLSAKELLIVDGFYNFTPAEKTLLELLFQHIPQTLLTLTADDKSSPLFEPLKETIDFLAPYNLNLKSLEKQRRFAAPALETIAAGFLQARFCEQPSLHPQGLAVWAAPERSSEVEAIAREILFLVHQGGYTFADIGIILRQPSPYLTLFQEAFTLLNIPWRYWGKEALANHPWVKAALELGNLFARGWERERVFRLLKSGYFDLPLLEADALEQAVQKLPLADEKGWRNFWGQSRRPSPVLEMLGRLLDRASLFRGKAGASLWGQRYREVLEEFLLEGAVRLAPADKRPLPLGGVEALLATIEEVASWRDPAEITFLDFQRALSLAVKTREVFLTDLRRQAVNLIGVYEARQWELPVVFVVGLVEGEFPAPGREDLFIKDYQRKALKTRGGADLPLAAATGEEELLFYFAVTRAKKLLYLTYPRGGAVRQQMLPSSLIEEIETLFSPQVWKERIFTSLPASWEPPSADKVYSPLALSLFALSRREENSLEGQAARWLLAYDKQHPWYRIQSLPVYQDFLAAPPPILNNKVYSVSELEDFAQCPLAYFYKHTLRLESLVLTYDEEQEYSFWGVLAHKILELYYRRYVMGAGKGRAPLVPAQLFSLIEEVLEQQPQPITENYLFLRNKEFLKQNLAHFLERERTRSLDYPFHPQELEWNFGKVTEPLTMESVKNQKIQLSGKIDRLDISDKDKTHALVIDYKYSQQKKNMEKRIQEGLELQIPLYILAAQELLGYETAGGLLYYLKILEASESFKDMNGIGRENLWPPHFGPKQVWLYKEEAWQEMLKGVKARVGELVTHLQQGYIKATPETSDYCDPAKYKYCQFGELCPSRRKK